MNFSLMIQQNSIWEGSKMLGEFIIAGLAGAYYSDKAKEKSDAAYAKASLKMSRAVARKKIAEEDMNNAIEKLINRKNAIISYSFSHFSEIVSVIKKINFDEKEFAERVNLNIELDAELKTAMPQLNSKKLEMTDKQLVATYLGGQILGGIAGLPGTGLFMLFVKDSKIENAYTEFICKEASVHARYASTVAEAIELLTRHINNVSNALTILNSLFLKGMKQAENVIQKNGYDKTRYSLDERKLLMLLFDIADALRIMVCAPIIDESNQVTSEIMKVIECSNGVYEKFCSAMNALEI